MKNLLPVGYALYFFSYSAYVGAPVLYVEDLFVEPKYRHHGLGKKLLSHLAKLAVQKECCRLEWHVFTWNEKAMQFYESLGAKSKPDLMQFRLLDQALINLANSSSQS